MLTNSSGLWSLLLKLSIALFRSCTHYFQYSFSNFFQTSHVFSNFYAIFLYVYPCSSHCFVNCVTLFMLFWEFCGPVLTWRKERSNAVNVRLFIFTFYMPFILFCGPQRWLRLIPSWWIFSMVFFSVNRCYLNFL